MYCFLIIFFTNFLLSYSQEKSDDNKLLKSRIEILLKNKEVDSVNQLMKNSTLPPDFQFKVLTRNLENAVAQKEKNITGRTYYSLGNFWLNHGDRVKAFENYMEAENIFRSTKNEKDLAATLMNKSHMLEDSREKIRTLEESINLFRKEKDSFYLIKAYMNLGTAYAHSYNKKKDVGNTKEAEIDKRKFLECYKIAKDLNTLYKNNELEGLLYIYYGEHYQAEGKFSEAIPLLNKAANIFKAMNDGRSLSYCKLLLGHISLEQKQYDVAIKELLEAEEIGKKNNVADYIPLIYQELEKAYVDQSDFKNALKYSKLYAESAVKFAEQSNSDKMEILALEKNISEKKLQLSEYEAKIYRNRIIIFSVIFIALLIGLISYFIIQNSRRKTKLFEKSKIITEIKLKNQQLEDDLLKEKVKFSQEQLMYFANEVNKIENFLDEVKDQVKTIPGSREEINALKMSFSELMNGKAQLKQVNSLSNELNQDFFFYLRKNFSSISKGDEQLLSYIILNIGSKEISRILNISDKSIYIKRYRLRKKLGLQNDETFEGFYQNIISKITNKGD